MTGTVHVDMLLVSEQLFEVEIAVSLEVCGFDSDRVMLNGVVSHIRDLLNWTLIVPVYSGDERTMESALIVKSGESFGPITGQLGSGGVQEMILAVEVAEALNDVQPIMTGSHANPLNAPVVLS